MWMVESRGADRMAAFCCLIIANCWSLVPRPGPRGMLKPIAPFRGEYTGGVAALASLVSTAATLEPSNASEVRMTRRMRFMVVLLLENWGGSPARGSRPHG